MKLILAMSLVLLACGKEEYTHDKIVTASGIKGYYIKCNMSDYSYLECKSKLGTLCLNGYDVIEEKQSLGLNSYNEFTATCKEK